MKVLLACLMGVLLAAVVQAQTCDPATAADALADGDLVEALGQVACKAPASVNLAETMNQLSANLQNLNLQQLQALPGLIKVVITRSPAQLEPFFSLSSQELNALMPLVAGVSADKLKVVLPLLTQQQPGTVARMLAFLKGVSRSQLEQLSPIFTSITEQQINLLVAAVQTLPPNLLRKLTGLVGGLGPVTNVQVARQQSSGVTMTPVFSMGSGGGMTFGPWGASKSFGGPRIGFGGRRVGGLNIGGGLMGRKLQEECVPLLKALEVSGTLTTNRNIGAAVCKFTPGKLVPVMTQILKVLASQSPKTLANLPALTKLLGSTSPEVFSAIARVPGPTLSALLSIQGVDPQVAVAQLKVLAAQDAETIGKLVFFTNQIPANKFGLLIGMFARLTDSQAAATASLLNSLSPGQLVLAMQLLEKFNFGVNNIGQSIPAAASRGSTFNIGPAVRVTVGGAGRVRRMPFGLLG